MALGTSLHIGLNSVNPASYAGWSGPLNACEADAATMAEICTKEGFQTSRLLTAAATRAAVVGALEAAAQRLQPSDILAISYSGHGGQLPDENGDETDGLDETWCLYDGQLLDDELYTLWAKFRRGVRIVVFSDSCHSGTILKNMALSGILPRQLFAGDRHSDVVPRAMPIAVQTATYSAHREFYDSLLASSAPVDPQASVILVSGCQDNQLSMDGPFNGAFTGALRSKWSNGGFKGSYRDFTKAIRSALPPTQSPNYMLVGGEAAAFEAEQIFTI